MKKTDERQTAVALNYDPAIDSAPRITAKGHGSLAQEILRLARENGVPVRQDKDLIQILSRLDLEQEIPPQVYVAVAEILAFIYRAGMRRGEDRQASGSDGSDPAVQLKDESPSLQSSGKAADPLSVLSQVADADAREGTDID